MSFFVYKPLRTRKVTLLIVNTLLLILTEGRVRRVTGQQLIGDIKDS